MIDVAEAKALSPLISTEGLLAAAYSPTDGHCTPESRRQRVRRGRAPAGARLVRNCAVTGIDSERRRAITGVVTGRGSIATDTVVCAAGAWSAGSAPWSGVDLPVEPLRRQILTTAPMPGLDPHTPFTIDFATSFYFHREGQGLLARACPTRTRPPASSSPSPTTGCRGSARRSSVGRPRISDVGHRSGWAGLYEMTPDHNALVGEAEGVSRFLYATGFSGHGFLMGPAIGEVMRDLYLGRAPVVDVSPLTSDRFAGAELQPELNIV